MACAQQQEKKLPFSSEFQFKFKLKFKFGHKKICKRINFNELTLLIATLDFKVALNCIRLWDTKLNIKTLFQWKFSYPLIRFDLKQQAKGFVRISKIKKA